jgi:hypothetical protein
MYFNEDLSVVKQIMNDYLNASDDKKLEIINENS